jgi:hypothetical protein
MKGNNGTNRTLYHDIVAQTITEPSPCFTVGTRYSGLSVHQMRVNSSWCKEEHKGRFVWPNHVIVSSWLIIQVLWSRHHRLCIWALFKVITGLAIAALPWMLDLWNSRKNVFVEKGFQTDIHFCCQLCCSCSVIFRNSPSQYTMISFCQCWFSLMVSLR